MSRLTLALGSIVALFSASVVNPAPSVAVVEVDDIDTPSSRCPFRRHTAERLSRARGVVEAHVARLGMSHEQATELRARFIASLESKLNAVSANGTVSAEEAREAKALARQLFTGRRSA